MLDEAEYASDTDESDEDYNPGGDGSDVASEVESEGEAENDGDNGTESKQRPKKRPATTTIPVETKRGRQSLETVTKTIEKDTLDDDDDDVNEDALWESFLSGAGETTKKTETQPKQAQPSKLGTSSSSNGNKSKVEKGEKPKPQAPAREKTEQKKIVTEIFDFAGEKVEVQKEILVVDLKPVTSNDQNSGESDKSSAKPVPGLPFNRSRSGGGGSSGLSSVLGQLGKKNKLSVLEKTKLDWTGFKKNEGIDEEIQTHNKGRGGYLERQDFLQRTDVRQFELEKNMRAANRRK